MDPDSYIWGGALAGLLVIAGLGVLLAQRGRRLRETMAVYVGDDPARGLLYLIWFAYVYSALNALGQASSVLPAFAPGVDMPPAVAFVFGSVWHALLAFVNALVPVVHLVALLVVAFLLHRHLKQEVT